MDNVFGRQKEKAELDELLASGKAEFIAVYGRRRVGKTFLINEYLKDKIVFQVTGVMNANAQSQYDAFRQALDEYGYPNPTENTWMELFYALQKLLRREVDSERGCVVFIDELPCFDTPRANFISALEHFWNAWASKQKNLKLIVSGSATSWMIKQIIDNHGGLHNRITHEMHLQPFTLKETEDYLKMRRIPWNRFIITQAYMVFGGVPYYLSLINSKESLAQTIDRLYFTRQAPLQREYGRLMASLFRTPEPYVKIIETLATRRQGLMREDIAKELPNLAGGRLSKMLEELEHCDFIRSYHTREKKIKQNQKIYQLTDMFSLFHLHFFPKSITDSHFWQSNQNNPLVTVWQGLAFEQVVMQHIEQVKQALGISGIGVEYYSWRSRTTEPKSQIDLILDRADRMLNLCEIKFCSDKFILTKDESERLRTRRQNFTIETGTKQGIFLTMITPYGLVRNEQYYDIQAELTLDDLFR